MSRSPVFAPKSLKLRPMKRCLTLLFALALALGSTAQVNFIRSQDWEAIKADAAKQKKLIFIDAYTDWCGWCKVMDKNTFSNPAIGNMMNHNFVNVKLEMEKEELGKLISMKYSIRSFPTYLVFNPRGKLIYVSHGYQEAGDFMNTLFEILNPNKHVNRPGYSNNLNEDYPEMYRTMMDTEAKKPKTKKFDAWLIGWMKDHQDLSNEVNWAVYQRFLYQMDSNYLDLFWEQKSQLDSLYGSDLVNKTGQSILFIEIKALARANKKRDFETLMKEKAPLIGIEDGGVFYKTYFFKETNDWTSYRKIMADYFKEKGMHNANFWNSQAWEVYEKSDDTLLIKDALVWIEQAAGESGDYSHLDTYAALLFKAGRLEEAKGKAELAISTGKAGGKNVQGTEELLEKIENAIAEKQKEKEKGKE